MSDKAPDAMGHPVAIREHPESDGSHVITVTVPDHGKFEILFSETAAVQFVRTLQQGFVNRQAERQVTPGFPALQVVQVDLAHGAEDSGLLVDTVENGRMVFLAPDDVLLGMKADIDRLIRYRKQRRQPS